MLDQWNSWTLSKYMVGLIKSPFSNSSMQIEQLLWDSVVLSTQKHITGGKVVACVLWYSFHSLSSTSNTIPDQKNVPNRQHKGMKIPVEKNPIIGRTETNTIAKNNSSDETPLRNMRN